MTNTILSKQTQKLKKINVQIREEKQRIDRSLGRELIAALQLDYATLDQKTIKRLVSDLVSAYTPEPTAHHDQPQNDLGNHHEQ